MPAFHVPPLAAVTRDLAAVASGRVVPDLVITGARVLSVYTEKLLPDRELWLRQGRIAAVKPARSCVFADAPRFDAQGGIIAPGLVDPHVHIESSMMTACAYAEAALLNGTTTIFCDSHEIGNVCDSALIGWYAPPCEPVWGGSRLGVAGLCTPPHVMEWTVSWAD